MHSAIMRRGPLLAALCASAVLAGCASGPTEAEVEAARVAAEAAALAARTPPAISLSQSVAQDAAVYLAFSRQVAAIRGGFESPEAIQAALRQGAAYDPGQISRGLVAYASIVALQSPGFVSGVNQYGINPTGRQEMIAKIVADPRAASYMPGAEEAAGLIMSALDREIDALSAAANSVESDAYAVQADGRRSWAIAHIADREARLARAKDLSGQTMAPPAAESARLFAAASNGAGLGVFGGRRRDERPYPPVVTNALALAALAALGAAGEDARANTAALESEPVSQNCLNESKLNLYQCLAASRPSYEDMFCLGRHIVRDLATCTRGAAMPAAIVTVSAPVADPEPPAIVTAPLEPVPAPTLQRSTPAPAPQPAPTPLTPTQQLNTGTGAPVRTTPGG